MVHAFDSTPHCFFVGKRFSHAHEHHVCYALFFLGTLAGCAHDLFHNFSAREVASEACLAGGAKTAGHCTACLGAYTNRCTLFVMHQYGFNRVTPIGERPQKLGGVSLVAHAQRSQVECWRKLFVQFVAQGNWEREHLGWLNKLLIQAFPDLLNAKRWLTFEESGDVFARCIVKTDH